MSYRDDRRRGIYRHVPRPSLRAPVRDPEEWAAGLRAVREAVAQRERALDLEHLLEQVDRYAFAVIAEAGITPETIEAAEAEADRWYCERFPSTGEQQAYRAKRAEVRQDPDWPRNAIRGAAWSWARDAQPDDTDERWAARRQVGDAAELLERGKQVRQALGARQWKRAVARAFQLGRLAERCKVRLFEPDVKTGRKQRQTLAAQRGQRAEKGRRLTDELVAAAPDALAKLPERRRSQRQVAEALAADPKFELSAEAIRKRLRPHWKAIEAKAAAE